MIPNIHSEIFKALPPDTPITLEHLMVMIQSMTNVQPQVLDEAYSTWDDLKLIDENVLAKWLDVSVKTLQGWRQTGKGPMHTPAEKKLVRYKVGAVRDWINSRQVKSTTQADTLKFGGMEFDSIFTTMYADNKPIPLIESFDSELNITGYEVIWTEQNSLASWFMSLTEVEMDSASIISELNKKILAGLDINEKQNILVNGKIVQTSLSHIVVSMNIEDMQEYSYLVNGLNDFELNWRQLDSEGLSSVDIANEINNASFIKMIHSIELFKKLDKQLPTK